MRDGTTLEGSVVGSADDAYLIKLADGTTKRVLKEDVKKREWKEAPPPAQTTPPATPVNAKPDFTTSAERLQALRKAAREGLELRARLVVGARELTTYVPLKVEGGYALSSQPKPLDLDQSTYLDRSVDEVVRDLWDRRAKPADERFHALKGVAGAVSWAEAEVLSASPAGKETEATIEWRTVALRGKTKIRVLDADSVKPHATLKLPVVLLVRQEEGIQFLAGQMGDSVSVWPVDFVLLAAEVGGNGRAPRTVASDLALRVGERSVAAAVKDWYTMRTRITCSACKGTRRCICGPCNGAGGIWKQFISATGDGSGMAWYPCGRCSAKGWHECNLCKDGLDEIVLKESLKRFGTYGKSLGGFLLEGQKIAVAPDGKSATVTTWIRSEAHDKPVAEEMRWVLDEKTGSWRPAS